MGPSSPSVRVGGADVMGEAGFCCADTFALPAVESVSVPRVLGTKKGKRTQQNLIVAANPGIEAGGQPGLHSKALFQKIKGWW